MLASDRRATPDDAAAIAALRMLMQKEINGEVTPEQAARAEADMRSYFAQSLADQSFIAMVALRDGKAVSTNGLSFYRKPPGLDGGQALVGYVTNVYTLPEYRGRGIATALFRQLIEEARAFRPDKLHLGATDMGRDIYEKCGFKPPRWQALEMRF